MSERDDDLMRGRANVPEAETIRPRTERETADLVRARQRSRAVIMAVLLGAFVVLVFAISIVKMTPGIAS